MPRSRSPSWSTGSLLVLTTVFALGCERERTKMLAPAEHVDPPSPTALPLASVEGDAATAIAPSPAPAALRESSDASNWSRCYEHFEPRSDVRLDAMRLGLMCGPSNGMRKIVELGATNFSTFGASEHVLTAKAGDCFRLFAVASGAFRDLNVQVVDGRSRAVVPEQRARRWLVMSPESPFCISESGDYRVRVSARWLEAPAQPSPALDAAQYALTIWRLRH